MAKHGQEDKNRRKNDPMPPAKVKCPSGRHEITNGPIPSGIHRVKYPECYGGGNPAKF